MKAVWPPELSSVLGADGFAEETFEEFAEPEVAVSSDLFSKIH